MSLYLDRDRSAPCCQSTTRARGGRLGSPSGSGQRAASRLIRRAAVPGFFGVPPTVILVQVGEQGQ